MGEILSHVITENKAESPNRQRPWASKDAPIGEKPCVNVLSRRFLTSSKKGLGRAL